MKNPSIKLAEDTISQDELQALSQWILTGSQLTKGPLTLELEAQFADYMGSKHALFVNSGSSANLVMAAALLESGRLKNNVAIAPAVSWVTTVTPFMQLGYETHLCDCNQTNLGLDLEHFEALCKEHKPSVAIIVHVLSHANEINEIQEICNRYDVILLEDACEALDSTYSNGKKLGTLGSAGSFSFYYGHHISTIEGGMVITDDDELNNIMRSVRSHGWCRDLKPELQKTLCRENEIDEVRSLYTFFHSGFNLRSTDLQAFLGKSQIKKLPEITKVREINFNQYLARLTDYFSQTSDCGTLSSFAFGTLVENRLETYKYLQKRDIECRPLICGNIGRHPFWTKHHGSTTLANADIVHDYGLYLPNHANLSIQQINFVCDVFKEIAIPRHFTN